MSRASLSAQWRHRGLPDDSHPYILLDFTVYRTAPLLSWVAASGGSYDSHPYILLDFTVHRTSPLMGGSGGSYDSHPYILLNFAGNLKSVFTLAHELGPAPAIPLEARAPPD
ncbi:hypothetical protein PAPYR_13522 [Paratrimastix pyriformis]|nr:hypothetical protein PAPYR_13522 [Paratrimastix pyriformis]